MNKDVQYDLLLRQVVEVVGDEPDLVPRMANVAALLHETFHFLWTGFYTIDCDTLMLGPFQGPLACMRIGYGKGVCGTAWKEGRTIVVPDVEQFPGHIACSSASRSEIVVPMYSHGQIKAVLDIDSERLNTFDDVDRYWLERVAAAVIGEAHEIYLAAGCFWGAQHFFKQIPGVTLTEAGFVNGNTANPTYEEVYTDTTGFAEAVRIVYKPWILPLQRLLELYFLAIDPTSLNRQGEDEGTRYRTGIYFTNEADHAIASQMLEREAKKYGKPLCVELEPMSSFYLADAYHQDYLDKNPQGYCHLPLELFELAKKG